MEKFKDWWASLEPSKQRNFIIGGLLVTMIAIFAISPKRQAPEPKAAVERPEIEVLADDRGAADISSLAAENRTMKVALAEQQRAAMQLQKEMQSLRQAVGTLSKLKDNPEELATLLESLNQMQLDMDNMREQVGRQASQGNRGSVQLMLEGQGTEPAATDGAQAPLSDPFSDVDSSNTTESPMSFDPLSRIRPVLGNATGDEEQRTEGAQSSRFDFMRDSEMPRQAPRIQIEGRKSEEQDDNPRRRTQTVGQTSRDQVTEDIRDRKEPETAYIPSSSLFKGYLMNGMDAPTGQTSSQQPHPVTIRVSTLAFLPNRFTTDVKDCFVLAGGFGNLASERVQLRTERLSCVLQDGGVIDVPLDGYISGEDGKVGIRGTVVHRTGALLARAALAGLGSGFAEALQPRQINSVRTGAGGGELEFQAPPMGEVLEIGAYKGAATAMENISQYYLDRASEIFPIIELDALRPVTIHVTSGVELSIMEPGQWSELQQTASRR